MKLLEVNPDIFNQELDFFPLYDGLKPSSMGLKKLNKFDSNPEERNKIFLFGDSFKTFRKSKEECRADKLEDYYQSVREYPEIIEYIISVLSDQNRDHFQVSKDRDLIKLECFLTDETLWFNDKYDLVNQKTNLSIPFVDAFDALAMQLPEDLVIHHVPNGQLNPLKSEEEKRDFAGKIHLMNCNGWDAKWAIDQTFNYIHKGVPRIDKIIPNAMRMMMSFFNKDIIYERIAAISFKTSKILNRHEKFIDLWKRELKEDFDLTIRVERQTVIGFPKSEAFLFTIRTYIYEVDSRKSSIDQELAKKRNESVIKVFENPDEKSYAYDIILKHQKAVLDRLK